MIMTYLVFAAGAMSLYDGSSIKIDGSNSFISNTAENDGGKKRLQIRN